MKKILCLVLCLIVTSSFAGEALPNFSQIRNVKEKKQSFFNYLKPIAQKINQSLLKQRAHLNALKKQKVLAPKDKAWLANLSHQYRISSKDKRRQIASLLTYVDKVPASLILAQAANESAWGTSRFARLGNNLFGQWCYKPHCGIVPSKRSKGMHHEVQKFSSPYEAVQSYASNLNRNRAYAQLRQIRANLRAKGQKVTGIALAQGLLHYSERGQAYVRDITNMIKANKLQRLD